MPTPPSRAPQDSPTGTRRVGLADWRSAAWATALGLVGGAINLNAPTVFFDSQIMLGGALAVFALLRFGGWGLLTGALALGATALRWGHPFELIIGLLQYGWLLVFLHRFNGGPGNNDNGRVVLATAAFWLVAGIPLELFLFNWSFKVPVSEAVGIGLKESVTGLFNATLGLLAFVVLRWRSSGRQPGTFSARGLTFATVLAAISIPGLGLTLILSHQLKTAVLDQQFLALRFYGDRAADLADLGDSAALETLTDGEDNKHFLLHRSEGSTLSSDPELFERLRQNYEIETPSRTGRLELGIFRPQQGAPVILTDADSYWFATYDRPTNGRPGSITRVTVVETPPDIVRMLDYRLLLPSFSALLGLLLIGTLIAEGAGRLVDVQFRRVLPHTAPALDGSPVRLSRSRIKELDTLVEAVNDLDAARQSSYEAAQATREELQRILEHLPIAVAANTLEQPGRLLYLNRQFVRTFGYTPEDIPTVNEWAELAYPDPAYRREVFKEWDAAVERALREKGTVESMEFEVAAKDGTRRRVIFHAVVMEDRLLVTLTDVTARRRVEAELQSAREELERVAYELTENIPVGTYTMVQPPDGGLAYFSFLSTRFLELTGLTREKARENPMNAFACVHPDDYDEWVRKNVHAFEHHLPFYETCRVVANGTTRWITAESTPRKLPDGSVVWEGVLTDISARKKAEDELAAARRREKEIEHEMRETLEKKLKTSLNAAAVAHEINQPLSRILLRARLDLEKEYSADKETLRALIADAERVVDTIEKMKVLLRNVETVQQPVDLAQIVLSSLHQLKQPLRQAGVKATHTGPDENGSILGDDVQLQMIVTNLVRNAIEAITGANSPRREIVIERRSGNGFVELVVGDSGPGWPGGTLDEMLLRSTKRAGSGIGLYVVKTALENHRGTLAIGRSPLGGAEFRLKFPQA